MEKLLSVIQTIDYGKFVFRLKELLASKNISMTSLAKSTGIDYRAIKRINDQSIGKADLDTMARICYALNCKLEDIIEYIPPK